MKEVYEDGSEGLAFILVEKGMNINTRKEDIQGQWLWKACSSSLATRPAPSC
ncbi:MAG: hypothetical protein IJS63_10370 [Bacteroidaceae bacterium]|nr:hypothetical protein [Bacteroidaceae bacterium]